MFIDDYDADPSVSTVSIKYGGKEYSWDLTVLLFKISEILSSISDPVEYSKKIAELLGIPGMPVYDVQRFITKFNKYVDSNMEQLKKQLGPSFFSTKPMEQVTQNTNS